MSQETDYYYKWISRVVMLNLVILFIEVGCYYILITVLHKIQHHFKNMVSLSQWPLIVLFWMTWGYYLLHFFMASYILMFFSKHLVSTSQWRPLFLSHSQTIVWTASVGHLNLKNANIYLNDNTVLCPDYLL